MELYNMEVKNPEFQENFGFEGRYVYFRIRRSDGAVIPDNVLIGKNILDFDEVEYLTESCVERGINCIIVVSKADTTANWTWVLNDMEHINKYMQIKGCTLEEAIHACIKYEEEFQNLCCGILIEDNMVTLLDPIEAAKVFNDYDQRYYGSVDHSKFVQYDKASYKIQSIQQLKKEFKPNAVQIKYKSDFTEGVYEWSVENKAEELIFTEYLKHIFKERLTVIYPDENFSENDYCTLLNGAEDVCLFVGYQGYDTEELRKCIYKVKDSKIIFCMNNMGEGLQCRGRYIHEKYGEEIIEVY